MVCMEINKQDFWYALFDHKAQDTDEYGQAVGTPYNVYKPPQKYSANISPAKGETSVEAFGNDDSYDKTVVLDKDCPAIDEYSVLWIDEEPKLDENGELATDDDGNDLTPYNYIVKKVAKSLNNVQLAIKKVQVS